MLVPPEVCSQDVENHVGCLPLQVEPTGDKNTDGRRFEAAAEYLAARSH